MASPAILRTRTARSAPPQPSGAAVPQQTDHRHDPGSPVGAAARYRYDGRTGDWWWSPEMFALLGLDRDDVEPGTEAFLRHSHPDDRPRILAALATASEQHRTFALETRLVSPQGTRTVVLVGEPSVDGTGTAACVEGICADLTAIPPPAAPSEGVRQLETEIEQLRSAMASRACIEQAKGILMLLTCCGEQAAFDLLAHISSHTHRKVRDVAVAITASAAGGTRLPDDVRSIVRDACPPGRLR